jgi:hypothetical protein
MSLQKLLSVSHKHGFLNEYAAIFSSTLSSTFIMTVIEVQGIRCPPLLERFFKIRTTIREYCLRENYQQEEGWLRPGSTPNSAT